MKLDFNFGLRLDVPEGNFQVRISDFDTEQIYFDEYISDCRLISVENYFIRWHVEVFLDGEKIFTHTLNLEGQPVAVKFVSTSLGDTLAVLPYLREFKKIHRCDLHILPPDYLREMVEQFCPDIPIIYELNFKTYATYYVVIGMSSFPFAVADCRKTSITRMPGNLFGIHYLLPNIVFKPSGTPITNEPYVCIGVQASKVRKTWLYPGGWDVVVDYLKSLGYRVFCIDMNAEETGDGYTVRKPDGAEDFTGNLPLMERANMLYHAKFFVGLASGLSWLADAVDCPVVMICGFSQGWCEFYTPYRVANRKVCNGCYNDPNVFYLFNKCPYHKDTPRELECQKKISPRMVINAIDRLIADKKFYSLHKDTPRESEYQKKISPQMVINAIKRLTPDKKSRADKILSQTVSRSSAELVD
ncbi:MAG: autotransporter strand-loop-strand O-heptosyltransferase [Selenomonadaceae bacterium]|nr:autotransporter strand-loop-strand O-heptosyltransferase [Selenomonadaceae bacterium]